MPKQTNAKPATKINVAAPYTPGQRRAAAKLRKDEEAAARAVIAAKLAAKRAQPAPTAKPLAVGSGALIGVAQGAMDGQPHTKRAVQEAAAKARAESRMVNMAKGIAGGPSVRASMDDPLAVRCNSGWILFADARSANAARRQMERQAAKDKEAAPKAEPKPAKTKGAPKARQPVAPKADRKYKKGPNTYAGAPGSWTHHMITTALAHTSTAAAEAAHAKSGKYADKKIHWSWLDEKKGFIRYV